MKVKSLLILFVLLLVSCGKDSDKKMKKLDLKLDQTESKVDSDPIQFPSCKTGTACYQGCAETQAQCHRSCAGTAQSCVQCAHVSYNCIDANCKNLCGKYRSDIQKFVECHWECSELSQ